MRPPPPSYPPPPTPSANSLPAGYTVTLSGPPDIVTKQQRLLPLSRNILCLPALSWTAPSSSPPTSISGSSRRLSGRSGSRTSRSSSIDTQRQSSARGRSGSRTSQSSAADQPPRPTIAQIRASVLKLHQEFLQRYETAREFLEAPRGLGDSDRRIVIYNGSERDAKTVCIEGLRQGLRDDEEVEKVWHEILEGGVDGLLDDHDGHSTPRGNRHRASGVESFISGEGIKHTQNTERLERGNSVSTTHSSIRSHSPPRSSFASEDSGDFGSPPAHSFSRLRMGGPPFGALPPLPTTSEGDEGGGGESGPHLVKTGAADSETDEPPSRDQRFDSTYSSMKDPISQSSMRDQSNLTPTSMLDFAFEKRSTTHQPTSPIRSSRNDSMIDPSTSLSPRHTYYRANSIGVSPVEPLFPNLREDVMINLIPETQDEQGEFVERLLTTSIARKHSTTMIRSPSSSSTTLNFRNSSQSATSGQLSPAPFRLAPFKVHLLADKWPLEIQNEIRALLTKYIPPSNTAVDTPATQEFPEASKWLLESEADLFAPLLSHGFDGLPEALCPSLDQIVAVGADGREQKESTLVDETERQACALAAKMSEHVAALGNQHGSRGCRIAIKHMLQNMLSYVRSHPGITLEDIAAGDFLLPCLEQCIKRNPDIRVIVLDFDLKSGSPAVLNLRSLLPSSLFKLLVVGEPSASGSGPAGHGNRIYVRTSLGKTTMSFSALPSPVVKEKPRIRRLESAKMSVMARADSVGSPWTKPENHDYRACVAVAQDAISARRIECGVITTDSYSRDAVAPTATPPISLPLPTAREPSSTTPTSALPIRIPVLPIKPPSPPPAPPSPLSHVPRHHPSQAVEHSAHISPRVRRGSEPSNPLSLRPQKPDHHLQLNDLIPPIPTPGSFFPPPSNARVQGIARRDSDTNSHGGGVSIASPVTHNTSSPLPLPSPAKARPKESQQTSHEKANKILGKENTKDNDDWRGGSYLIPDDDDDDDEPSEEEDDVLDMIENGMRVETVRGMERIQDTGSEFSPVRVRNKKASKAWRLLGIGG